VVKCTDRVRRTSPPYSSATDEEKAALVKVVDRHGKLIVKQNLLLNVQTSIQISFLKATAFQCQGRTNGACQPGSWLECQLIKSSKTSLE
jgi:hypothetical protein